MSPEATAAKRSAASRSRPDEVAMEQAFYGKNVQSTLALGEARGVATFVVSDRGLSVNGYAPALIKRAIVQPGADVDNDGYALLKLRRQHSPTLAGIDHE